MTGEQLAAELGAGWKAVPGREHPTARKSFCEVWESKRCYVAKFANGVNRSNADGRTPAIAVEKCLLGVRAAARATLHDIDAVTPGISTKPGILG